MRINSMTTYETSATVEEQGRVQLAGVPFAPGTQVEVIIHPLTNGLDTTDVRVPDRSEKLFAAMDKSRNMNPIGRLNREGVRELS